MYEWCDSWHDSKRLQVSALCSTGTNGADLSGLSSVSVSSQRCQISALHRNAPVYLGRRKVYVTLRSIQP